MNSKYVNNVTEISHINMSILPDELYVIIINFSSYGTYSNLRLICKHWSGIVEDTLYREYLHLVRKIHDAPDFVKYLNMNDIRFVDGTIGYEGLNYGYSTKFRNLTHLSSENIIHPHVNAICMIGRPLDSITNTYGTFTLTREDDYLYVKHNAEVLPPLYSSLLTLQPYIVRADTEIYVMGDDLCYYTKDGWFVNTVRINANIHFRNKCIYERSKNIVTVTDYNDNVIGSVKIPSKYFGFGKDYFVMYTNRLEIRHYN